MNNAIPPYNPSLAGTMPDYPGMGYPGMPGAFPLPGAGYDPDDPNGEDYGFGYEYDRPTDMKAYVQFPFLPSSPSLSPFPPSRAKSIG
jgi:hypothetical protein